MLLLAGLLSPAPNLRLHLGQPQVIGSSQDSTVALNILDWDVAGDGYEDWRFVAPASGYYYATATATFENPQPATIYSTQIVKDAADGSFTEERAYGIAHASCPAHLTVSTSDIFHLQRGDSLRLVVWHNAGRDVWLEPGYRRTWLSIVRWRP